MKVVKNLSCLTEVGFLVLNWMNNLDEAISPTWVWMILCRHSVLACRNPFPQTLHTNGRAPVCTGMWRVRL